MKKNIVTIFLIILAIFIIYSFNDYNYKRTFQACLAGSHKFSESTDIETAKKICEDHIKKNIKN